MIPVGEPLVIQVQYGSLEGNVKDGPRISVPGATSGRGRGDHGQFVATDNSY
jgi:hypothetical protein